MNRSLPVLLILFFAVVAAEAQAQHVRSWPYGAARRYPFGYALGGYRYPAGYRYNAYRFNPYPYSYRPHLYDVYPLGPYPAAGAGYANVPVYGALPAYGAMPAYGSPPAFGSPPVSPYRDYTELWLGPGVEEALFAPRSGIRENSVASPAP